VASQEDEWGPFTKVLEQQREPEMATTKGRGGLQAYQWEILGESPLTGSYGSVQVEEPTEREGLWQEASAQWSRRSGHKASPPGSPREGTMSTARLPLIRAIRPYLLLDATKSIDKKPERIDYVGPKRDVFDAERAYRALDDFMKTNHWSAWQMMRLIYEGKVYAGQLSKAMQGMINGRRPYFALTEETQQVEENDVVGTTGLVPVVLLLYPTP
jgi:hypothetical protein